MARGVFISTATLATTGLAIFALTLLSGCQQSAPLRLSVMADAPGGPRFVETKTPYINPVWVEDDDQPGPVDNALSVTGSVVDTVFSPVVFVSGFTVRFFTDDRPSTADKLLEDRASADNRREGMNKLADFGFLKNEIFEKRCREIATRDVDYTVRATAIRTANRARDFRAMPLFIKGLTDPNEWVRLESAKALANIPNMDAAGPLVETLNNPGEARDVRIAAADALKHYRTLPVVRALSAVLSERNFAIAWQARRSLRYLTDRDFGYDVAAWLAYFSGNEKAPPPPS